MEYWCCMQLLLDEIDSPMGGGGGMEAGLQILLLGIEVMGRDL